MKSLKDTVEDIRVREEAEAPHLPQDAEILLKAIYEVMSIEEKTMPLLKTSEGKETLKTVLYRLHETRRFVEAFHRKTQERKSSEA